MKIVDILIPTYKPGEQFLELIEMLNKQSIPIRNIIVMNTEAVYWEQLTNKTPDLLNYKNIQVHHILQADFDHAATRHAGMCLSDADICVCMTQDAIPSDTELLERLIAPLEDEKIAISYARQLPRRGAGPVESFTRIFNYPEISRRKTLSDIDTLGVKAFFCSDVCAAYNRATYEKLGGFVAPAIFNEDMIYAAGALKAGYDVYYAADAMVLHSHEYCFMQQLRRYFDLAVSQVMHPEVFSGISSEREGKRLVLATCKHLIQIKKPFQIIDLIVQSGGKYVGYFLGKRYQKMSKKMICFLSASPYYWEKNMK